MEDTTQAGAILIRDGTLLPPALQFESSPYVSGWKMVRGLDGYSLERKIRAAGWTFFCLAGELKTIFFGTSKDSRLRTAIKRILKNPTTTKFNSLEIMRVDSKRFIGLPYTTVYARSRHIQQGMILSPAKDVHPRYRAETAGELNHSSWQRGVTELPLEEPIAQPIAASILNQ
jgi:hypothetical protein